jgi:hypothetical protein
MKHACRLPFTGHGKTDPSSHFSVLTILTDGAGGTFFFRLPVAWLHAACMYRNRCFTCSSGVGWDCKTVDRISIVEGRLIMLQLKRSIERDIGM